MCLGNFWKTIFVPELSFMDFLIASISLIRAAVNVDTAILEGRTALGDTEDPLELIPAILCKFNDYLLWKKKTPAHNYFTYGLKR